MLLQRLIHQRVPSLDIAAREFFFRISFSSANLLREPLQLRDPSLQRRRLRGLLLAERLLSPGLVLLAPPGATRFRPGCAPGTPAPASSGLWLSAGNIRYGIGFNHVPAVDPAWHVPLLPQLSVYCCLGRSCLEPWSGLWGAVRAIDDTSSERRSTGKRYHPDWVRSVYRVASNE